MTCLVSTDEALRLSRGAEYRYAQSTGERTFGEWVLSTIYPDHLLDTHQARDFCGAQRASDGRTYLTGMLLSGSLQAKPLRAYLQAQEEVRPSTEGALCLQTRNSRTLRHRMGCIY